MNEVENFLGDHKIKAYTVNLLDLKDSKAFVLLCRKNGIRIQGIEGFHINKNGGKSTIQIDLKHSMNFSGVETQKIYDHALNFLSREIDADIVYDFDWYLEQIR